MDGGTLTLRGEHITLAHAVKAVGLADTGGQAKLLVRAGQVTVNGEPASQPGRKLRAGDRFGMVGREWTLVAGMCNKEEEGFSGGSFVRESPTPGSGESNARGLDVRPAKPGGEVEARTTPYSPASTK